jgi:hypothetical protein
VLIGPKDAKIMDTTVTEGLQPRRPGSASVPPQARVVLPQRLRKLCGVRSTRVNRSLAWRLSFVSGLQDMAPFGVALAAISLLLLTGCKLIGGKTESTEEKPAPPPRTSVPRSTTPTPTPAQQPQTPPPAIPSQPQHLAEAKRPPAATTSKGAEQLVAPGAPALPRSEEAVSRPTEANPVVSPSTRVVAPMSSGAVRELVFKGPPRARQPQGAGRTGWLWLGLALGAAIVGLGTPVFLKRRHKSPKLSKSNKEELVMPKEFLLKEPAPLPKETMTFD